VTATVSSSDGTVAQIVTPGGTGATGQAQVQPGSSRSGLSDLQLRLFMVGRSTVSAGAPGFNSVAAVVIEVLPNQLPAILLSGAVIGRGLQRAMTGTLGAPAPANGVSVRVTSDNPNALLVSNSPTVAGAATADVFVPAGQVTFSYIAQGMQTATMVSISVTAPGYSDAIVTEQVVVPMMRIKGLPSAATLGGGDIPFQVEVGVPNAAGTDLQEAQAVRAGAQAVLASVTSANAAIAQIVTATGAGATGQAFIQPGQSTSSLIPLDFGLRPSGAGVTTISVGAPVDFIPGPDRALEVQDLSINLPSERVGVGLMTDLITVTLGSPAPAGGVLLELTTLSPNIALPALDAQSGGALTIIKFVPAGETTATFVIHGLAAGFAEVIAKANGYVTASAVQEVVPFTARIDGLPQTAAPGSQNPFAVHLGIPTIGGTDFERTQRVRTGGPAIRVTMISTNATVGRLISPASSTGSATAFVDIAPGQFSSPNLAANGGVELLMGDPGVIGMSTTVRLLTPHRVTQGEVTVTVQ
jgi:hypothetical protein